MYKPYHHSEHFGTITQRTPLTASFNSKGKDGRFKVKGRTTILYNKEPIDLAAVEQLWRKPNKLFSINVGSIINGIC